MGRYILSIDNGLTTTKAVIFSTDGEEIVCSVTGTQVENRGDFAEIDMEQQWRKTAGVIRETVVKAGIHPSEIIGVGNSGHGAGLYCLDGDGKPVRRAISSMDARAGGIIDEWNRQGKSAYDRLYHNFWSGQPIPILYWLKKNEPWNYRKIEKILMVKDWIIYRLTGEAQIEFTDGSNSGLINPVGKATDEEIFCRFDVGEMVEKVPGIRKTTDIAGYVNRTAAEETGLMEGTPVMGGVFDVIACALGSGVYDNDRYSLIAGTWNVNSGIEEKLVRSGETVKCSLFSDIDRYLYVESSATSAVNFEWFIESIIKGFGNTGLSNKQIYKTVEEGIQFIRPDASNLLYMPFLYKSHLSRNLYGSFLGIQPEHSLFHLLRAVFEGVVFAHGKHIENLKKGGIIRNKGVLSGGASNSALWSRMFSDILGMEIITTRASQVGALGTAVCTSVAVGEYGDFREAIQSMVKEKEHFYPDERNHEIYNEKFAEFKRIIEKFDGPSEQCDIERGK